jgi:hypothetical protein
MFALHSFNRVLAPAGLLAMGLLAACSDSGPMSPSEPLGGARLTNAPIVIQAIPTPAEVVVPIGDAGSFVPFTADNSGRATTEFWDNNSADNNDGTTACNIGFFASGTFGVGCDNETAGTSANQGGFSQYWADGAEDRDASAFMFNGDFEYEVSLVGAIHGSPSEVGWFTVDGGVYTFNPVAAWGSATLNSSITINTGGDDWGFYVKNAFNPQAGGCSDPDTDCSDAEGSFGSEQFQQFSLMTNDAGDAYLVGTEDNELNLFENDPPRDSDYNDYIFRVEPQDVPESLDGRMTGGVSKLISTAGDEDVSFSFTLHCDITLSNNIEINWGGGNKWHLDKPISTAFCSLEDDPTPPVAPINIFEGTAVGRYNGVDGYPIEFTLIDKGEGKPSGDMAGFTIYQPDGVTVLLQVDLQSAENGNTQAHFDQPHGQHP